MVGAPDLQPPLHGSKEALGILAGVRGLELVQEVPSGEVGRGFELGLELGGDGEERIGPAAFARLLRRRLDHRIGLASGA